MADKISITPNELTAQAAALANLGARMMNVKNALRNIGSLAASASSGAVGISYSLLPSRAERAGNVLQVGANLANESAQKFTNVDATIRRQVESLGNNALQQLLRNTVTDSALKQPVSAQTVKPGRMPTVETPKN